MTSHGKNRPSVMTSCRLQVFRTDAVFHRESPHKPPTNVGKRGVINGLTPSADSLKRLIFLLNNCDRQMRSMATITFQDEIGIAIPVECHKRFLKNFCQRLRDKFDGIEFVWVREFQSSRLIEGHSCEVSPVHWHVFTTMAVDAGCEKSNCVDREMSAEWSAWLVKAVRKLMRGEPEYDNELISRMLQGGRHDGCVRWENLYGPAGGRYAAKEGAKRFQKVAPEKWQVGGGEWWDSSKSITCTPLGWRFTHHSHLKTAAVKLGNGEKRNVTLKHQWGKGGRGSGDTLDDRKGDKSKRPERKPTQCEFIQVVYDEYGNIVDYRPPRG